MAGAARLLRITESGSVDPTLGPQVDSLLSLIFWGSSFVPPPGTLQALIATGSLDILDNEALAQALTPWQAWVADHRRYEDEILTQVSRLVTLLAVAGINGSDLAWHELYPETPWTSKYTDAWTVIGSPVIRTAIADLWFTYGSTTRRQATLREGLDEILRLLPPPP